MQGKDVKEKSRRKQDGQRDGQRGKNAQIHVHMPHAHLSEGSKSSPVIHRYRTRLELSSRSRSEGNLVSAQMFDLKSQREVGLGQVEKNLHLPRLQQSKTTKTSPVIDNGELRVKALYQPDTDISRALLRMSGLGDNYHRRMLNEYIKKENREYLSSDFKRESLLQWLNEQKISNT